MTAVIGCLLILGAGQGACLFFLGNLHSCTHNVHNVLLYNVVFCYWTVHFMMNE